MSFLNCLKYVTQFAKRPPTLKKLLLLRQMGRGFLVSASLGSMFFLDLIG